MKKQSGFTLIELAIVLVIIGLLLGGVLKGQELINSAKVKSLANDFRNIEVQLYSYQDKYKALPGDDPAAVQHLGASAAQSATLAGNGQIGGAWDSETATDESVIFWQHVRLAGLATGSTTLTNLAAFAPRNSEGGKIGIQGGTTFTKITGMGGNFVICSDSINGKLATQIDTLLDDGETSTGSVRAIATASTGNAVTTAAINTDSASRSAQYTVCKAN